MARPGPSRAALALALCGLAGTSPARADEDIPVPSGQAVRFQEVISDAPGPSGRAMRFRFVAPEVAALDLDQVGEDMRHLCEGYALSRIPVLGPQPAQVIISLADRPVAFGDPDPEVMQFFDAFRPEGGRCIPEAF